MKNRCPEKEGGHLRWAAKTVTLLWLRPGRQDRPHRRA